VKTLIEHLPANSTLALGNSSAVRFAQLFPLPPHTHVICNRGVNGIDGSLSSAVGFAIGNPNQLTVLLIGDLSFFYDMNALCHTHLPHNLRVLLLNNGGGEIFRLLPGLGMNRETKKFVLAQHQTTAEGWVKSLQAEYLAAHNMEEARNCMDQFFNPNGKFTLCEIFTQQESDKTIYEEIQKF
jgi:2-succinyl-5-enolpyruvyl-6-hydroxy-3-cyclohexene-1-carboxylate synthase